MHSIFEILEIIELNMDLRLQMTTKNGPEPLKCAVVTFKLVLGHKALLWLMFLLLSKRQFMSPLS